MKILESNKVLQSVFSGMAINYLNTEYQNGYIRDIYNECKVVMNSSNSITVSTGMIVVEGIRLLFEEAETFNITSFPDSSLLHHLVLKVTATTEGENTAEIINRINEPLRQDEILKTGSGVYELELASYLLSPSGISNFAQTLLPIILTNEELQSFKEMIDELDKKVDALDQVIITANEDAERALTTVSNLTVGTVQKGVDPEASIEVDVIKKTAKLNLTLPKGDKGDNGTVITIDGEPQDYFDGNVINDITNESYNILDVSKFIGTSGFENAVLEDNGYEITGATGSADAWGYANSNVKLTLDAGTYYFNYETNSSNQYSATNIFTSSNSNIRSGSGAFTLSKKTDIGIMAKIFDGYFKVNLTKTNKKVGFQSFNQKRQITNPQAEFLKEEFEKQVNLIDFKDSLNRTSNGITSSYESNTGGIRVKGTATATWSSIAYDVEDNLKAGQYVFSIDKVKSYSIILQLKTSSGNINKYIPKGNLFNTFTIDEDIIGYTIFLENITNGATFDEAIYAQLQKGKIVTEHNKYNSSSHITNAQADFLKKETNKQINLFNMSNLEFGTFNTDSGGFMGGNTRIRNKTQMKISAGDYIIDFDNLEKVVMYVYGTSYNFLPEESFVAWQKKPFKFTIKGDRLVAFGFAYNDDRTISSLSELPNVLLYKSSGAMYYYMDGEDVLFTKEEANKSLNLFALNKPVTNNFSNTRIMETGYKVIATTAATAGGGSFTYSVVVLPEITAGTYTITAKAVASNSETIPQILPYYYKDGQILDKISSGMLWPAGGGDTRSNTFSFSDSDGKQLCFIFYSNANGTVNKNDYIDYTYVTLTKGNLILDEFHKNRGAICRREEKEQKYLREVFKAQSNLITEDKINYFEGDRTPYNGVVAVTFTFKANTTYTVRLFQYTPGTNGFRLYLNESLGGYFAEHTPYHTFSVSQDITFNNEQLIKIGFGKISNVGKLMIVEGKDVPSEYVEGKGKVVFASFDESTGTLSITDN